VDIALLNAGQSIKAGSESGILRGAHALKYERSADAQRSRRLSSPNVGGTGWTRRVGARRVLLYRVGVNGDLGHSGAAMRRLLGSRWAVGAVFAATMVIGATIPIAKVAGRNLEGRAARTQLANSKLKIEWAVAAQAAGNPAIAAITPYIDVHVHFDDGVRSQPGAEVDVALREMEGENAARLIFFPGPFVRNDPKKFDLEAFMAAVKEHPGKLAFEGGGGTLNPMIQEAVRAGSTGAEAQREFKERAEEIVRDGAVGFGELTAEHIAYLPGQVYEHAPPDHPLFLMLADIAAEHDVPIDLHMEAVPHTMKLPADLPSPPNPPELEEDISRFERLLEHDPRAKILWAHAGSDNTGYRTPELCRRLLTAHANLYMEIKMDPASPGKNPPMESGRIKPEWLKLFEDFPDRFVIGSDQHYGSKRSMTGPQRWQQVVLLLNQLPGNLREKISMENALRIFRFSK
jgi:predicted TIM-barrel fold metal-dependent hydrolase